LALWNEAPVGPVKIALWGGKELELPDPRRAEAKSSAPYIVTLTLYCASDEDGEDVKPISTHLSPAIARDLAIRLWLAADASEDPAK
jgi:hypothetical protein